MLQNNQNKYIIYITQKSKFVNIKCIMNLDRLWHQLLSFINFDEDKLNGGNKMKHAMIMTVNNNIGILRMFIDLFDDERYDFYILIDKKSDIDEKKVLDEYPKKSKVFFVPRVNIYWGGYSQINAYLHLLDISSKEHYDYYHFFQGSDFPLKTKDDVNCFFEKNKGKEFIDINRDDFAYFKCGYYHLFVEYKSYRKNLILKALNHFCVKFQKVFRIKRNKDLVLYHGSALSSLTHECARYILDNQKNIKKRFKFSLGADEVFLQTIIAESQFKENIYRFENSSEANSRMIDWKRRDGNSPYTFIMEDYDTLINSDEGICFVRKVTEEKSIDLVKKIYKHLKNKENITD